MFHIEFNEFLSNKSFEEKASKIKEFGKKFGNFEELLFEIDYFVEKNGGFYKSI